MHPNIPRATYRLQLHKGFDFEAASAVLPYLQRLGISHVYCSPISRARPGSLHGYDVVDHREINPELGGRAGFERFAAAARAHGLGLLLDIVPNHMGVIGADNPWWSDVLEHGPASDYAGFFDIDWQPFNRELEGKLLLPVLGHPYGDVLDQGELQLACEAGSGHFALRYYTHRFPLDTGSWPVLLRAAALQAQDLVARSALEALAEAAAAVTPRSDTGPGAVRQRAAAAVLLKRSLADLLAGQPAARSAVDAAVAAVNTEPRHDALHALHEAQAYRLASWRVAADEINYRRFFDVNELAALRIEDERVFEATHALVLELTASGMVDGLRIDHPDGLRDPAQYFQRLQQAHARELAKRGQPPAPLYVVAEKITAAYADQPGDWALAGTTGYRFGALVNGLFVDRRQAQRFERIWQRFSGQEEAYAELVYQGKLAVARKALASELTVLATQLKRIAGAHRRTRDHGFETLRQAVAEAAANMPVYRTYVVEQASADDRRFVAWAIAQARRRSDIADGSVFDFLQASMLGEAETDAGSEPAAGHLQAVRRFAWRFQQFCAPVAAKGVEDTAFYRYHRLVSLNEVGGDPASFGTSLQAFHGANADRAARWPHTMLATSTHDNKRSEDVRNRIDALSELPAAWRLGLRRWHLQTRSHRREVNGASAPSAADELLLYQTLLGSLPSGELDEAGLATFRERIERYMLKAAREAKQGTSWVSPDAAYEEALTGFVGGVLGRVSPNPVLADLRARAAELAWYGGLNSLAMTLLKFSCPGVPDIYQGNEVIDLSLVDPDNRRPVDYARRQQLLDELTPLVEAPERVAALARLAATPEDGRLKLWATWRLLQLRSQCPALFRDGDYLALKVHGAAREHIVAFARRGGGELLIVLATRLHAQLPLPPGSPVAGAACWGDTEVDLAPLHAALGRGRQAEEWLTASTRTLDAGRLRIADIFTAVPGAVFRVRLE